MEQIYQVCVYTKNGKGTVTKSNKFKFQAKDKEHAEKEAISRAKLIGMRGKIHISDVFLMIKERGNVIKAVKV